MNLTNRLSQRRTSVGLLVAALSLAGLAAGPRAQASGTTEGLECATDPHDDVLPDRPRRLRLHPGRQLACTRGATA